MASFSDIVAQAKAKATQAGKAVTDTATKVADTVTKATTATKQAVDTAVDDWKAGASSIKKGVSDTAESISNKASSIKKSFDENVAAPTGKFIAKDIVYDTAKPLADMITAARHSLSDDEYVNNNSGAEAKQAFSLLGENTFNTAKKFDEKLLRPVIKGIGGAIEKGSKMNEEGSNKLFGENGSPIPSFGKTIVQPLGKFIQSGSDSIGLSPIIGAVGSVKDEIVKISDLVQNSGIKNKADIARAVAQGTISSLQGLALSSIPGQIFVGLVSGAMKETGSDKYITDTQESVAQSLVNKGLYNDVNQANKDVGLLNGLLQSYAGFRGSSKVASATRGGAAKAKVEATLKDQGIKATKGEKADLSKSIESTLSNKDVASHIGKNYVSALGLATAPVVVADIANLAMGNETGDTGIYGANIAAGFVGPRGSKGKDIMLKGEKEIPKGDTTIIKEPVVKEPVIKTEPVVKTTTKKNTKILDQAKEVTAAKSESTPTTKAPDLTRLDDRYQDVFPANSDKRLIADTYLDPKNNFFDVAKKLEIDDRLTDHEKSVIFSEFGTKFTDRTQEASKAKAPPITEPKYPVLDTRYQDVFPANSDKRLIADTYLDPKNTFADVAKKLGQDDRLTDHEKSVIVSEIGNRTNSPKIEAPTKAPDLTRLDTRYQDVFPANSDKRLIADTYLDPRRSIGDFTDKIQMDNRLTDHEKSVIISEANHRGSNRPLPQNERARGIIQRLQRDQQSKQKASNPELQSSPSPVTNFTVPFQEASPIAQISESMPATPARTEAVANQIQEIKSTPAGEAVTTVSAMAAFDEAIKNPAPTPVIAGGNDKSVAITAEIPSELPSNTPLNPVFSEPPRVDPTPNKELSMNIFQKNFDRITNSKISLSLWNIAQVIRGKIARSYSTQEFLSNLRITVEGVKFNLYYAGESLKAMANDIATTIMEGGPKIEDLRGKIKSKDDFQFDLLLGRETTNYVTGEKIIITQEHINLLRQSTGEFRKKLATMVDKKDIDNYMETIIYDRIRDQPDLLNARYSPDEIALLQRLQDQQNARTTFGGTQLTEAGILKGLRNNYRRGYVLQESVKTMKDKGLLTVDGKTLTYPDAEAYVRQLEQDKNTKDLSKWNSVLKAASESDTMHFIRIHGSLPEAFSYKNEIYRLSLDNLAYKLMQNIANTPEIAGFAKTIDSHKLLFPSIYRDLTGRAQENNAALKLANDTVMTAYFTFNPQNIVTSFISSFNRQTLTSLTVRPNFLKGAVIGQRLFMNVSKKEYLPLKEELAKDGAFQLHDQTYDARGPGIVKENMRLQTGAAFEESAVWAVVINRLMYQLEKAGYKMDSTKPDEILAAYLDYKKNANDFDKFRMSNDLIQVGASAGMLNQASRSSIPLLYPLTRIFKSWGLGNLSALMSSSRNLLDDAISRKISATTAGDARIIAVHLAGYAATYYELQSFFGGIANTIGQEWDEEQKKKYVQAASNYWQDRIAPSAITLARQVVSGSISSPVFSYYSDLIGTISQAAAIGGDQEKLGYIKATLKAFGMSDVDRTMRDTLGYGMEEYFANKLGLNTFGTYNATVAGTEKISQGGILDKMMMTRGAQFESQMYLDQNMKDSFMNSFLPDWMPQYVQEQVTKFGNEASLSVKPFKDLFANSNKTEAYNPETGLTEKVDSVVDQFRDADRTFKTLDNIGDAKTYDQLLSNIGVKPDTKYVVQFKSNGVSNVRIWREGMELNKGDVETTASEIIKRKIIDKMGVVVGKSGAYKGLLRSDFITANDALEGNIGVRMNPTINLQDPNNIDKLSENGSFDTLPVDQAFTLLRKNNPMGYESMIAMLGNYSARSQKVNGNLDGDDFVSATTMRDASKPTSHAIAQYDRVNELKAFFDSDSTVFKGEDKFASQNILTSNINKDAMFLGSKEATLDEKIATVKELEKKISDYRIYADLVPVTNGLATGLVLAKSAVIKFSEQNPDFNWQQQAPNIQDFLIKGLEMRGEKGLERTAQTKSSVEGTAKTGTGTGKGKGKGSGSGIGSITGGNLNLIPTSGLGTIKGGKIALKANQLNLGQLKGAPQPTLAQMLSQVKNLRGSR